MDVTNYPGIGCVSVHPATEGPGIHSLDNPYVGWQWYQHTPLYDISDTGKRTALPRVEGEVVPSRRIAERAARKRFPEITGWAERRGIRYATVRSL